MDLTMAAVLFPWANKAVTAAISRNAKSQVNDFVGIQVLWTSDDARLIDLFCQSYNVAYPEINGESREPINGDRLSASLVDDKGHFNSLEWIYIAQSNCWNLIRIDKSDEPCIQKESPKCSLKDFLYMMYGYRKVYNRMAEAKKGLSTCLQGISKLTLSENIKYKNNGLDDILEAYQNLLIEHLHELFPQESDYGHRWFVTDVCPNIIFNGAPDAYTETQISDEKGRPHTYKISNFIDYYDYLVRVEDDLEE